MELNFPLEVPVFETSWTPFWINWYEVTVAPEVWVQIKVVVSEIIPKSSLTDSTAAPLTIIVGFINKRAQRALGRSPEEKVKGHSGAIYRGPLMLSTKYWWRTSRWCYTSNMKALGLVVSDKKICENCILKTYFLTAWPTYATNQNHLNNFGRELPRDHSCWVLSNYHKQFKIRSHLKFSLYNSM